MEDVEHDEGREGRTHRGGSWERVEPLDHGSDHRRRLVSQARGRADDEREVQRERHEVAATAKCPVVSDRRTATSVSAGHEHQWGKERSDGQQADEQHERPDEAEGTAGGPNRLRDGEDSRCAEQESHEQGEQRADDGVGPEEPRLAVPVGVDDGAREPPIGVRSIPRRSHGDEFRGPANKGPGPARGTLLPGPCDGSAMQVDIGNALAAVADPGVPHAALDALDDRVAAAHDRIEAGVEDEGFGYAALALPERTDPAVVREAVEPVADADAVLTVGIGGSALGAATITAALGPASVDHRILDNADPAHTREVLDALPLADTAVHVVSNSGTTTETLANFLVVREAMDDAGVDWTDRTLVTTGESGPLRDLAATHDLPTTPVPDGVPGRFSALSAVGLVPAAIAGHDIEALLAGGREGREALAPSLFDCPAYAYGAVAHALETRGATINAVMPYAERLEAFAEWFAQLWAESLGKDGQGQTPVRALGATDQHSQLQLYRSGRRDKLVTFVRPQSRPSLPIPDTSIEDLAYLAGTDMGAVLDAEFAATEASLAAAGRPSVRVEIDALDACSIGRLLYDMEAACALVGELADVDAFTQPAVDWGKRATRGLLGGGDSDEAAAVDEKTTLVVD